MSFEKPDHFKVERDEAGCAHCNHGGSWTVTWGEGEDVMQLDTSFDDKECAEDAARWMQQAFEVGQTQAWLERVRSYSVGELAELPLPRLQLTWRCIGPEEYMVDYALLMRAEPGDIRDSQKVGYLCLPLGGTKAGRPVPPIREDGSVDTPRWDGVHILRDSVALGIPAYAVYGQRSTKLEPRS